MAVHAVLVVQDQATVAAAAHAVPAASAEAVVLAAQAAEAVADAEDDDFPVSVWC